MKKKCNLSKELVTENLFNELYPGEDPKSFWHPIPPELSFKKSTMLLETADKKECLTGFFADLKNEIGTALLLSSSYKLLNGHAELDVSFNGADGKLLKSNKCLQLSSTGKWEKLSLEIPFPDKADEFYIKFRLTGQNARFSVKQVSVKVIEPLIPEKIKKVKIKKEKSSILCEGIYIAPDIPQKMYYDRKAAYILRKHIYNACGEILPVLILDKNDKQKLKDGRIFIGKAAIDVEYMDKEAVDLLNSDGYMIKIDNGIAAVAGKNTGVISGIYTLIEKIFNLVFVSESETEPPLKKYRQILIPEMSLENSPAFELRMVGHYNLMYNARGNPIRTYNAEAIGYTDSSYLGDAKYIGEILSTSCHTGNGLLSFEKYAQAHPEYFAMDKMGNRPQKGISPATFDHFCMSNPQVQQLITEQVLNWMKVNPEAAYFYVTFGDGRDLYCRCDNCAKMGSPTDRYLKFINGIAEKTTEKYPNNRLLVLAYCDTEKAPEHVKPHRNVKVLYCPYPLNWINHLSTFCEENQDGMRTLNGWIEKCPDNIYVFDYPSCYGERLNLWPAFYATYDRLKLYTTKGIKGLIFCGLVGRKDDFPGFNSFNAMMRYLYGKLLWNPNWDIELEIDRFMKLYYGPAAHSMREFFDLIHNEVKKRKFIQQVEEVKRGFVTRELALESYRIFREAEKRVKSNPRYHSRVLLEKMYLLFSDLSDRCKGNGEIKENEYPEYVLKLAEFIKSGKKFGLSNFVRNKTFQEWFWDTALLKIDADDIWYKSPLLKKFLKNPLDAINKTHSCAVDLKQGGRVPIPAVTGAINMKRYSYKCPQKENLKLLRRTGSGYEYIIVNLSLAKVSKNIKLELEGIDNDKEEKSIMEILINNIKIFKGDSPFLKDDWRYASFTVPDDIIRTGQNIIEIRNITPPEVSKEEKKYIEKDTPFVRNYYYGWFIISGIKLICE